MSRTHAGILSIWALTGEPKKQANLFLINSTYEMEGAPEKDEYLFPPGIKTYKQRFALKIRSWLCLFRSCFKPTF
jgi:hypothetical protein